MGNTRLNSQNILDGSVDTADLKDGCVTLAKLASLTTKGDLLVFSTVHARLPVGSDGQVLTADAASTAGVKWAAAAAGASSFSLISSSAAKQSYTTTSAEQTPVSFTITGGTLGTTKLLRVRMWGYVVWNTTAQHYTVRVKLGGTTLFQADSITFASASAIKRPFFMDLMLSNNGATNVQTLGGTWMQQAGTETITTGSGGIDQTAQDTVGAFGSDGVGTLDTTANQTFAVTMQMSASTSNISINVEGYTAEILG